MPEVSACPSVDSSGSERPTSCRYVNVGNNQEPVVAYNWFFRYLIIFIRLLFRKRHGGVKATFWTNIWKLLGCCKNSPVSLQSGSFFSPTCLRSHSCRRQSLLHFLSSSSICSTSASANYLWDACNNLYYFVIVFMLSLCLLILET